MKTIVKTFDKLTNDELYEILALRARVFIVEQKSIGQDVDGYDKEALHVYLTDDDKIVAYVRVIDKLKKFSEVSIGKVVSSPDKRGLGLGFKVMQEGIKVAKDKFLAKKILVDAQLYAKGFYEKLGFKQISEVKVDDGISHILMEREDR